MEARYDDPVVEVGKPKRIEGVDEHTCAACNGSGKKT